MTQTPPTQHCSTALWRGYATAQFYARSQGHDAAFHVSPTFRTWRPPWEKRSALEDDPSALAALAALEADLLAAGWERVDPAPGDAWYELRFRRGRPAAVGTAVQVESAASRPDAGLVAMPHSRGAVTTSNGGRQPMIAAAEIGVTDAHVVGYRAALGRLTSAASRGDPGETYLTLFETLSWATNVIDSRGNPDGAIANGLRWARNAVRHQWAKALELRDVLMPAPVSPPGAGPVVEPAVVLDWFWLPVERVPKPRRSKHESDQREAYRAEFAERRAREPLERLLPELASHPSTRAGSAVGWPS